VSVKTPNCFTATTTCQRLTRRARCTFLYLFPSFRTRVHACVSARVRVRPLPPSRYKHRTHASLPVHDGAATRSFSHPLSSLVKLSRSLAPRNPLISERRRACCCRPNPRAFSLLAFSLSLSLSLSLYLSLSLDHVFTLSHPPCKSPFPHSRHPIPDTRYLIMLNASGFCGRIMRPHCPRTLFRSLRAAFSPSLSLLYACCRQSLVLSCAQRKDL